MKSHVVLIDEVFGNHIVVSKNSLDFPDYLAQIAEGKYKNVKEGSKKECNLYVDEITEV